MINHPCDHACKTPWTEFFSPTVLVVAPRAIWRLWRLCGLLQTADSSACNKSSVPIMLLPLLGTDNVHMASLEPTNHLQRYFWNGQTPRFLSCWDSTAQVSLCSTKLLTSSCNVIITVLFPMAVQWCHKTWNVYLIIKNILVIIHQDADDTECTAELC